MIGTVQVHHQVYDAGATIDIPAPSITKNGENLVDSVSSVLSGEIAGYAFDEGNMLFPELSGFGYFALEIPETNGKPHLLYVFYSNSRSEHQTLKGLFELLKKNLPGDIKQEFDIDGVEITGKDLPLLLQHMAAVETLIEGVESSNGNLNYNSLMNSSQGIARPGRFNAAGYGLHRGSNIFDILNQIDTPDDTLTVPPRGFDRDKLLSAISFFYALEYSHPGMASDAITVGNLGSMNSPIISPFGQDPDIFGITTFVFDKNGKLIADKNFYATQESPTTIFEEEAETISEMKPGDFMAHALEASKELNESLGKLGNPSGFFQNDSSSQVLLANRTPDALYVSMSSSVDIQTGRLSVKTQTSMVPTGDVKKYGSNAMFAHGKYIGGEPYYSVGLPNVKLIHTLKGSDRAFVYINTITNPATTWYTMSLATTSGFISWAHPETARRQANAELQHLRRSLSNLVSYMDSLGVFENVRSMHVNGRATINLPNIVGAKSSPLYKNGRLTLYGYDLPDTNINELDETQKFVFYYFLMQNFTRSTSHAGEVANRLDAWLKSARATPDEKPDSDELNLALLATNAAIASDPQSAPYYRQRIIDMPIGFIGLVVDSNGNLIGGNNDEKKMLIKNSYPWGPAFDINPSGIKDGIFLYREGKYQYGSIPFVKFGKDSKMAIFGFPLNPITTMTKRGISETTIFSGSEKPTRVEHAGVAHPKANPYGITRITLDSSYFKEISHTLPHIDEYADALNKFIHSNYHWITEDPSQAYGGTGYPVPGGSGPISCVTFVAGAINYATGHRIASPSGLTYASAVGSDRSVSFGAYGVSSEADIRSILKKYGTSISAISGTSIYGDGHTGLVVTAYRDGNTLVITSPDNPEASLYYISSYNKGDGNDIIIDTRPPFIKIKTIAPLK